jgi:Cu-processing system permease protein
MAILIITRLTFREAVRRRIVLAALVLGVAFLIFYSLGFYFIRTNIGRADALPSIANALAFSEAYNFLFMSGMYAVTFLAVVMAALISADTLAGEISSGTIQTLVAKPVRRAEIVLGKWVGFAGLLALYLLLMAGGVTASIWLQAGYLAPNLLRGVGLIYLESLVIMTFTLMCSSTFSTLATGGVVFGLYGLGFIGGWVEQFGSLVTALGGSQAAAALQAARAAVNVGIVSSLIFPSEALWKRAAFEMTSPLLRSIGFSPFSAPSVPSLAMIIYAGVYLVLALAIAVRQFSRRDL